MALIHTTVATGVQSADQISVNQWNENHSVDINGIDIPAGTLPAAPAAGNTKIFCKNQGERMMPAFMGPSGLDSVLQPHLAKNGWGLWKPTYTGTTITAIGVAAPTATGTATSAPWAATSLHTRGQRVDYLVTVAATTAVAGYRAATANWRGIDGYHHIFRICPATGVTGLTTKRCFIGMAASVAAPTDVEPSTQLNIAGVGYDAADATWFFMTNNAAGVAVKQSTGLARPSADRQGIFTVQVFSPPGGAWIGIGLTDEVSGTYYASGQLSADIPVNTTAVAPRGYCSVGGTSSVTGLTLFSGWMDSDN